jgi:thiol-disulfide isomerase/thioredoxin
MKGRCIMLGKSLLVALCATGLVVAWAARAQQEKKQADQPPAAAAGAADKRSPEQVQQELQKTGAQLQELMQGPEAMFDPAKRKEIGPKVVPLLRRMMSGIEELAQVEPRARDDAASAKLEFLTMLSLFGDPKAPAELDKLAKDDPAQATAVQGARLTLRFWADPKDEAAQLKVLDEVQKLARANPKDDAVAQTLMKMAQMGAASKAVTEKAETIIVSDLTGDVAKEVAGQIQGQRKMREGVGKPIELAGTTTDGTKFSTKDWKGKVILVDFWATWCGPCMAELPRVKKAYLNHHAKGLEVLGVSCDNDVEELKSFAEKNKDAPWPQLFDPKENPKIRWHPLAKEWGINGIPTMFLIDKKGILRSVEARANFEEEIPKLLEEKTE